MSTVFSDFYEIFSERSFAVNVISDIEVMLFDRRDDRFAELEHRTAPTLEREHFIGVRTPELRKLAKDLRKREDIGEFLVSLPHRWFEEDQLHVFIISEEKDFRRCIELTEAFLPYVDNCATCDQFNPKVFARHRDELLPLIDKWLGSEHTYTVRFAIGCLMRHFLGTDFKPEYADRVAAVSSDQYYINMMRAWYFAEGLAKNYDQILPYIEQKQLDVWTHNKSIQKAVESFRVSDEHKKYLRSLKYKEHLK